MLGWSQILTDGRTGGHMDGRKTRSLHRAMPEVGATIIHGINIMKYIAEDYGDYT